MSTRVTFLLGLLLWCCTPSSAHACSCLFGGGFLEVAGGADAVFSGKVLRHHVGGGDRAVAMDVEIAEQFTAKDLPSVVRIWGDNGYQCRRSISEFPIGSTWVFATSETKASTPTVREYELSACGEYALKKEGAFLSGVISGPHADRKRQMVIAEFRPLLANALAQRK